jgi:8-oxo-dGTP diphosphatase
VFVAREFEGNLIDSPEGNLKWIADEDVLNLNLWEGDRIFLHFLEEEGFFSGKFVYQNGQLLEHSMLVYPARDIPAADP